MYWIAIALALFGANSRQPVGFDHWTQAQLKQRDHELAAKARVEKVASETLATYGNHYFMLAHREASGEAELHETQSDVFVVREGKAALIVGGTIISPRTIGPGEVRGKSIAAGEQHEIGPGDVVHIPPQTPHQLLLKPGVHFSYFVVKVSASTP